MGKYRASQQRRISSSEHCTIFPSLVDAPTIISPLDAACERSPSPKSTPVSSFARRQERGHVTSQGTRLYPYNFNRFADSLQLPDGLSPRTMHESDTSQYGESNREWCVMLMRKASANG